jgi:hypothetical protein
VKELSFLSEKLQATDKKKIKMRKLEVFIITIFDSFKGKRLTNNYVRA